MPRLQAKRMLEDVRINGKKLTVDGMYDLVLAATGSQEEAERATKEMMAAQLRANETPE